MSKQQTAMQIAIDKCNKEQKYENVHIAEGFQRAMSIMRELLSVEKQQITNAHFKGSKSGYIIGGNDAIGRSTKAVINAQEQAEQYYNDTFKTD